MLSNFLSKLLILTCGTLYPAYRSYKAVRSKNMREYVKWMMYWIVFALFLNVEVVADIFIGIWFPFYYESKILFLVWLISPYTRGASFLYRKFIHPLLVRHEKDIDNYLVQAKEHGYTAIVGLGSRGFMYAREIVASAAVKGQLHLVNQLRKSYSVGDLSRSDDENEANGGEQHQRRAWQGYYDDGGRIVEEEFQYLYSDENVPKGRPALRQSNRRTVTTRSITSGYSTLPRRRRRDGTL